MNKLIRVFTETSFACRFGWEASALPLRAKLASIATHHGVAGGKNQVRRPRTAVGLCPTGRHSPERIPRPSIQLPSPIERAVGRA
jgi:hypothetical protein